MDTTVALSAAAVADLGEAREASAAWTEVVVDNSVVKGEVIVAGTHHAASPIIHNNKKKDKLLIFNMKKMKKGI